MASVYVASAFSNKDQVRQIQREIRAIGHKITHDWTTEDASHLNAGSSEFFAFLEQCGKRDFEGILRADVLVVVAHPEMRDTRAEMGIALGAGIPVVVLYPERAHSVFYGLAWRARSVPQLLAYLTAP